MRLLVCLAALCMGCRGDGTVLSTLDGAVPDAGQGMPDAEPVDSGPPPIDATPDARVPVLPTLVTVATGTIYSLWADDRAVYWTTSDTVWRLDKGTGVSTILDTGEAQPLGLFGDGSYLYWTVGIPVGGSSGAIRRCRDDGEHEPEDFVPDQPAPYHLTRKGTLLFWTDYGGSVRSAPLTSPAPAPVTILTEGFSQTTGIAPTAGNIYFEEVGSTDPGVWRVPQAGGDAIPIQHSPYINGVITSDGDHRAYWIVDKELFHFDESAGSCGCFEKVIDDAMVMRAATVAGGYLYWLAGASAVTGHLKRMPIDGEQVVETLSDGFLAPSYTEMRVGGDLIYWFYSDKIRAVPR
jgi:hypothetical protein